MTEIYSKIDPEKLLHFIIRHDEIMVERFDVICETQRMQLSVLNMAEGKTFKPHKHNDHLMTHFGRAQEIWVIITGRVLVTYYDEDGKFLKNNILNAGDLTCTLFGGHTYEAMTDGTRVYEVKTGPYFGQEHDKSFIY